MEKGADIVLGNIWELMKCVECGGFWLGKKHYKLEKYLLRYPIFGIFVAYYLMISLKILGICEDSEINFWGNFNCQQNVSVEGSKLFACLNQSRSFKTIPFQEIELKKARRALHLYKFIVLGQGLVDFIFANNNNNNKKKKNPHLNFLRRNGTRGYEIWHTDLTHKNKILGQLSQNHLCMQNFSWWQLSPSRILSMVKTVQA